jgi:hypothetical protein
VIRTIWAENETPAFRHFFHYYYFVGEAGRVMHPEQQIALPYFYEAEVTAFDYKEYRKNAISGMAGNRLIALPSGS